MLPRLAGWLAATALLAGCASTPPAPTPVPNELFRDALFVPPARAIDTSVALALSPQMQGYMDTEILPLARRQGNLRQGLLDALYARGKLQLEYDSARTRSAAEAFEERRGNCLSLVLMTSAFAKAMDLPVRYQSVYVDEVWSRGADLYFVTGHINLSLGRRLGENSTKVIEPELLTIDFIPTDELKHQRSRVIEEETVIAMYMNNRAAELLDQGRLDEAYWWARASMTQDARFMAAYNTLGVIYKRHGQEAVAEQVFRAVLAREPGNVQSLANLVLTLRATGQTAEAERLQARLAQLQPDPPFKYFDQGVLAMQRGDFKSAKQLFTREVERSAYFHEFHFWLALANYGLGDMAEVRRELALARDNSTTVKDRQLYAAKLERLRSARSFQ